MSHIYNKSQHPVEVKRISMRIWSLRDEIEAALYRRIQECETAGIPLNIDDIKEFYGLKSDAPLTEQPQLKLVPDAGTGESVDDLMASLAPDAKTADAEVSAEKAPEAQASAAAEVPAASVEAQETKPAEPETQTQAADAQAAAPSPDAPAEGVPPPTTDTSAASVDTAEPAVAAPVTDPAAAPAPGALATPPSQADSIQAADQIIAEQKNSPPKLAEATPLIKHPYQRQAPDSDKISYGFALLSDVNMDWLLTFSKHPFVRGQSVVIEFLIPRPFMMNAEVMVCNHFAMRSRIISETKPDFRLQCRFTYLMKGERARLREFLTSVEPSLPPARKPAPKKEDDAGPL